METASTTASANQPSQPITMRAYVRQNFKAVAAVAIIVLLAAAWLYQVQVTNNLHKQAAPVATTDRKAAAHAEATTLRDQVAKVIELSSNETPTVATVNDVAKLQN